MTDKENFPGRWQGVVPEDLKLVTQGQAGIRVDLTICLECLQHLAWPVYKPLEKLKVLDPACGTGEQLLQMAVKYGIDSYTAYDPSPAALQQARDYAKQLGLENVNYVDALPSEGKYDLIIMTRPLQHIDNLADFMQTLKNSLAPDGLLIVHAYTGANPEENLYLREEIAALKADQLGAEEVQDLIRQLLDQPLKDHIDGLRECDRLMREAGLHMLCGLHPRNYNPASYLPGVDAAPRFFESLSVVERAYLAEQFCGQMLRHSLLYAHADYQPEMPSLSDAQKAQYIPHLTPYLGAINKDGRVIAGLVHRHLMLQPGIEFEDLSLPPELYRVLTALDGKKNCEQVHRRFLPMPWERFQALIQACVEEEIIYLHRAQ